MLPPVTRKSYAIEQTADERPGSHEDVINNKSDIRIAAITEEYRDANRINGKQGVLLLDGAGGETRTPRLSHFPPGARILPCLQERDTCARVPRVFPALRVARS